MIGTVNDGGLNIWLDFQVDPVADVEASFRALGFNLLFHPLSGTLQVLAEHSSAQAPFLSPFLQAAISTHG